MKMVQQHKQISEIACRQAKRSEMIFLRFERRLHV